MARALLTAPMIRTDDTSGEITMNGNHHEAARRLLCAACLAATFLAAGCAAEPSTLDQPLVLGGQTATFALSSGARRARAADIRDVAARHGITEGYLLAGIADAETRMSHCWSELRWACQGPPSVDCGGGPVVAGAGDGPCSRRQGGLGMFQFDAGTHTDTLRREGDRVLGIRGNVEAAIDFTTSMVVRSTYISGVSNREQAIAWMNGVRIGNARFETWIRTVTHYYNGCRPSYSCFRSRYAHYWDNTVVVHGEMGAGFWGESAPADPPPASEPPAPPTRPAACGAMRGGEGLAGRAAIDSCDGRFRLVMQGDGNLVLYERGVRALWATGTSGGHTAVMQEDGDFVLYDGGSRPLWSSRTHGNAGAFVAVQDDGNLVVYTAGGRALWDSGTWVPPPPSGPAAPLSCGHARAGEGLGPGRELSSCDGRFRLVMQGDGNLVLYQGSRALWATGTHGRGGHTARMEADGDFVLYDAGSRALWSSRTAGHDGAFLAVQDDGNLVVYTSAGRPLWASDTCCR